MIKKFKLPTILGIIILLVGTFAGVFFLNMTQVFRIGASPENSPKDVRVSSITDTTANISWITDADSTSFVLWGTSSSSLNKIEKEDSNDAKYKTHLVTLSGLSPNTQYFFKINSNGTEYDNNSLPWKFTTGPSLETEPYSIPISGTVITASGSPVKRGLVYINIEGYLVSTLTSDAGSYVFQLGQVRTSNLRGYTFFDEESILANKTLEFSVQSGSNSFASAQINLLSSEAVPPIVMGQTLDFRNMNQNDVSNNPNASLNLPQNSSNQTSKFAVPVETVSPSTTTVILESIDNGEVISTDKPQFFGKGPKGQELTISIHSEEAITDSVKVPSSGSWSYTVPSNLSPGEHTITITWLDTSGITRSLTRNFIVQAAEAPAFTASQSGSIASPTPTTTQSAVQASPSATPKATVNPSATPTASPAPVPVTGELTPTLFLFIMSLGILVFSFGIWKVSENA